MTNKRAIYIDLRPERPWVAAVSALGSPLEVSAISTLNSIADLPAFLSGLNTKARYTHGIVGGYPAGRFLRHATLEVPAKAREENFFDSYLRAHYQLELSEHSVAILNPSTGLPVDFEKVVPKELIFVGAPQSQLADIQGQLVAHGCYPDRLEVGTLATLGGLIHYQRVQQMGSCVVMIEWGEESSLFTICSSRRIELSRVIPFGQRQLIAQVCADLGLKDEQSAQKILATGSFDFVEMGALILKRYIKELQASAGFFEVQTGQALKHFVMTLLPAHLGWVEQVLAQYLGLDLLSLDYTGWANTLGINFSPGALPEGGLGREQLGLFSLMINTPPDGEKRSS
jgi:hypothetical protein